MLEVSGHPAPTLGRQRAKLGGQLVFNLVQSSVLAKCKGATHIQGLPTYHDLETPPQTRTEHRFHDDAKSHLVYSQDQP